MVKKPVKKLVKKPVKKPARQFTQRRIDVSGHKRSDPRINKKVDVSPYTRNQEFKQFKNITDKTFLENIQLPKKYQDSMNKVKAGFFEKNITESERKAFDQPIKIQKDIYNKPTKDAYQKELNRSMKRILKTSGIAEIEERMGILKRSKLIASEDMEASVKHLNDERKEIGLEIRYLKKLGKTDPQLENKRQNLIDKIKSSPELKTYREKAKIIDARIEKYKIEEERFYKFIDSVNKELEPIEKERGFTEFYLKDDLTFTAQEKKDHQITHPLDGTEYTAHTKNYKFEDLDANLKENVLKIINKNFKKEYLQEQTEDFLNFFKDKTAKPKKTSEQGNLDKLIGINTKIYEEYGDMKTFDKNQIRLDSEELQDKLDKDLKQHWKDTEEKRKKTHTSAMYREFLKKAKKVEV